MKRNVLWYELSRELKIESMGYVNITNRHPTRNGLAYWVLVLVEKGQRTLCVDNRELRVGTQEFFLLPPYSSHEPLEDDRHSACYVHFYAKGEMVNAPTQTDASRLLLPAHGHLPTDLDCFSHLRYLCNHTLTPYANQEFLELHLQAILAALSLHCQKYPQFLQKKTSMNERCLDFIREHTCKTLRAEDYEKELGLSYHQINQHFKKQFGYTVKQYYQHIRMEYAALLLQAGVSVQQTASQCGFEDYYFFIRSFRKAYGISPGANLRLHGMK